MCWFTFRIHQFFESLAKTNCSKSSIFILSKEIWEQQLKFSSLTPYYWAHICLRCLYWVRKMGPKANIKKDKKSTNGLGNSGPNFGSKISCPNTISYDHTLLLFFFYLFLFIFFGRQNEPFWFIWKQFWLIRTLDIQKRTTLIVDPICVMF